MDLFEKKYIESLGFTVVKDNGQYGEAHSNRPKGKRILNWNREGANCDYFGKPIEEYNGLYKENQYTDIRLD